MEPNGRPHVREGFLVGVPLTDHDPLDPYGVGNEAVLELFDDDLHLRHCSSRLALGAGGAGRNFLREYDPWAWLGHLWPTLRFQGRVAA